MTEKAAYRIFLAGLVLVLALALAPLPARAQGSGGTLAGTISDTAGKGIAGAKISAKNSSAGQMVQTQTDSSGHYTFANLAPGDYEISVGGRLQHQSVESDSAAAAPSRP